MDRLTVGILIALTALIMMHGLGGKTLAAENTASRAVLAAPPSPPRSERVLGLIVALEALRAAPELLDRSKV
jgi:hypothetical protein